MTIMLPFILVLLAAQSALCVPVYDGETVRVRPVDINSVSRPNTNTLSGAIEALFERVDGGEREVFSIMSEVNTKALVNTNDPTAQAIGLVQAIALFGEVSPASAGDACGYANVINSFSQYRQTGNVGALNSALSSFTSTLAQKLQAITAFVNNPNGQKFVNNPAQCAGSGTNYPLDLVWNSIIDNAGPLAGIFDEQYCAARRQYNGYRIRTNNYAAATTAAALFGTNAPGIAQALPALRSFVQNPASGGSQVIAALNRAI